MCELCVIEWGFSTDCIGCRRVSLSLTHMILGFIIHSPDRLTPVDLSLQTHIQTYTQAWVILTQLTFDPKNDRVIFHDISSWITEIFILLLGYIF